MSHCIVILLRDHPRGCGEHQLLLKQARVIFGSSPRMRGALVENSGQWFDTGIIPADAGSTSWYLS